MVLWTGHSLTISLEKWGRYMTHSVNSASPVPMVCFGGGSHINTCTSSRCWCKAHTTQLIVSASRGAMSSSVPLPEHVFSAYFTIIWALSSSYACYTYMYYNAHLCFVLESVASWAIIHVTVAISIHALENSIRQHVYMHILTLCDVILIHSLNMTSDLNPPPFTIRPFWESTNANPANISSPVVFVLVVHRFRVIAC